MKKRILSTLLALALLLSFAPTAFAADSTAADTITLPNGETVEIPTVKLPDTPSAISEDATKTVTIKSMADFEDYSGTDWYSGTTFEIATDLDFSKCSKSLSEWSGYITYFYGTMTGVAGDYDNNGTVRYPIISGIPNNCGLIYGIIGGTIENLTFDHSITTQNGTITDGGAYFVTFLPIAADDNPSLTMKNITVTGDITLTASDQSNYSPFAFCAYKGGLIMENCVNYANITGNIYGAVFCGYYPMYAASYTFKNCVNYGDIKMQYAGMFFGNSSSLESNLKDEAFALTIEDCANYGEIRGTKDASYIVAPVSTGDKNIGDYVNAVEKVLEGKLALADAGLPDDFDISPITESSETVSTTGDLCVGNTLTGFKAELNSDGVTITVTRPDDESDVDHYTVSVGAYVKLWNKNIQAFTGTDRYTVTQDIAVSSLDTATFEPELKVYDFADAGVGTLCDIVAGYKVYLYKNNCYYQIEDNMADGDFSLYATEDLNDAGTPAGGGTVKASIVTVSAYNSSGVMLDCATVSLK